MMTAIRELIFDEDLVPKPKAKRDRKRRTLCTRKGKNGATINSRFEPQFVDDEQVSPVREIPIGKSWLNMITGQLHRWDGKDWAPTGSYPYGRDPMGLING